MILPTVLNIFHKIRLNQKESIWREGLLTHGFKVGICEAVQQEEGMNPDGEHLCIGLVGEAFKLGMSPHEGLPDLKSHAVVSDLFEHAGDSESFSLRTP
jgi:hypothetical protein